MAAPAFYAAAGLLNIGQALYGRKRRRSEMADAQANFNRTMANYQNLDTSNPYANMENPMEDLPVNQQEADFIAQQQQMGIANTMNQMKQATGNSGVAALAQAMANQQSQNAVQAGARIGNQEARNASMAAQGAMNIQSMERQGDYLSQQMNRQQASTELGMAQVEIGRTRAERDQATNQVFQGMGQLGAAGIGTWNAYSSGTGGRGPLDNSFFGVENNFG